MAIRYRRQILFLVFLSLNLTAVAAAAPKEENKGDFKAEIRAYIMHHLQDSHDFNILSYTDEKTGEKSTLVYHFL